MARPFLSRLLSRRSPVRRSPPIARPRLSVLEDRLAPAVLDIDAGGVLSFTGANVASSPALSLSGGNFNFIDALDPITLGPGAIAAGYTVGSGGATATGPAAGVTALNFVFGTSPTAIFFGSFVALVPSIDVVSGTAAGSSL